MNVGSGFWTRCAWAALGLWGLFTLLGSRARQREEQLASRNGNGAHTTAAREGVIA